MFAAHIGTDKGRRNLTAHRTDIDNPSRRMARLLLGTQHWQKSLGNCKQAYDIHLKLIADIVPAAATSKAPKSKSPHC
jgi:hypothetical protein